MDLVDFPSINVPAQPLKYISNFHGQDDHGATQGQQRQDTKKYEEIVEMINELTLLVSGLFFLVFNVCYWISISNKVHIHM